MTSEPQILDFPPAPSHAAVASSAPVADPPASHAPPTEPSHPALGEGNRGNGKIARLPKVIRDQINNWILDGVSYPDIIQRLGEHGKELRPNNLYQWKSHGYQDWLLQRDWLDRIASKSEFSSDILSSKDSSALHEAGLRIAAAQMFDQLMRFGAALDATDSQSQPEKFARLVNALSRLTREALAFQKYRDACAKAVAAELQRLDPDRKLTDAERFAIVSRVDDILGIHLPVRKPKPEPTPAPASEPQSPAA